MLARSNEVESPRQGLSPSAQGLGKAAYELLALSGAEDLGLEEGTGANPLRILASGILRPADRAD